ncbi:hypothetical protein [Janthinobacterium sp. J1-1]|uniref:hypothetical protein n=1 Tax=Janthinobacterium sp. J1-1 TaxID=3065910 RepID=UPI002810F306|nr:hypothetical protein [Janthinobacterium sp. J1-1]
MSQIQSWHRAMLKGRRRWDDAYEQQETLRALAQADGGSANSLLRTLAQTEGLPVISQETARRYLHEMQFSYKRYRYSLKKSIRLKLSASPHG